MWEMAGSVSCPGTGGGARSGGGTSREAGSAWSGRARVPRTQECRTHFGMEEVLRRVGLLQGGAPPGPRRSRTAPPPPCRYLAGPRDRGLLHGGRGCMLCIPAGAWWAAGGST